MDPFSIFSGGISSINTDAAADLLARNFAVPDNFGVSANTGSGLIPQDYMNQIFSPMKLGLQGLGGTPIPQAASTPDIGTTLASMAGTVGARQVPQAPMVNPGNAGVPGGGGVPQLGTNDLMQQILQQLLQRKTVVPSLGELVMKGGR